MAGAAFSDVLVNYSGSCFCTYILYIVASALDDFEGESERGVPPLTLTILCAQKADLLLSSLAILLVLLISTV